MKIGIISDTHGDLTSTKHATCLFRQHHVSAVFHCGDIGSFDVLNELSRLKVPVHAVLGNVDRFSNDWKYAPTHSGVQLHGRFGEIELSRFRFALLHSDDKTARDRAMMSGEYDFVFTGHTHEFHDLMVGETRCINPGSAGRGSPKSCVVLDLASGKLEMLHL